MITVKVDRLICQNFGQCIVEVPQIFSLNADEQLEYIAEVDDADRDLVEAAIDVCPVQAIRIAK